jgi:hypothetical protein
MCLCNVSVERAPGEGDFTDYREEQLTYNTWPCERSEETNRAHVAVGRSTSIAAVLLRDER